MPSKKSTHIDKQEVDLSELITQAEAARLRGVTRSAIQGLVQRGRLRSVEMFGRQLVYRSEVVAFEKEAPGPKKSEEGK